MDLNEAQRQMQAAPPATTLAELRSAVALQHASAPQRAGLAAHALDQIEAALTSLAALGHRLHLVEGAPTQPEQFPMMLYRGDGETQETLQVESESEMEARLEEGWRREQTPGEGLVPEPSTASTDQPQMPPAAGGPPAVPSPEGPTPSSEAPQAGETQEKVAEMSDYIDENAVDEETGPQNAEGEQSPAPDGPSSVEP